MRTGDKRQVAVLSVVALGAVAFLVMQLMPSGGRSRLVAMVTGSPEDRPRPAQPEELPLSLIRDGFSHAKLARPASTDVAPTGTQRSYAEPPFQTTLEGEAPWIPPVGDRMPGGGRVGAFEEPEPEPAPEESTGGSQQPKVAEGPRIVLSAVLSAKRRAAFLSVDGRPERSYREGDLIAEGIRIMAITRNGITVRARGSVKKVEVGETVRP